MREFRCRAKAAISGIKNPRMHARGVLKQAWFQLSVGRFHTSSLLQPLGDLAGGLADLVAARLPGFRQSEEEPFEGWPAVTVVGRKIGAAVKRFQVRREKHR